MNEKKSRRPIRAGQAYLDAIRDDPQARMVLADSRGYPKPRLWCAVPARQTG